MYPDWSGIDMRVDLCDRSVVGTKNRKTDFIPIDWLKSRLRSNDSMRVEQVEIYSDATNAAVMRHPGRRFPGILIQGDTFNSICRRVEEICALAKPGLGAETDEELGYLRDDLRDDLRALLSHYEAVLPEHGIPLPFFKAKR